MATTTLAGSGTGTRLALGFAAAALAVLLFHQPFIALLSAVRGTPLNIYSFRPIPPLGVPAIVNIMFWGGLWGVVYAAIEGRLPAWPAWAKGFAFGAILPVLAGWFVVAPLKGLPMAAGWDLSRMIWSPLINGMFGMGLGLIYPLLVGKVARG